MSSSANSIKVLTGTQENEIKTHEEYHFTNLGINSRLGALLLNNVLYFLSDSRPMRARRCWSDDQKGGGVFCKAKARISINDLNEVGLYFENSWGFSSNIRVATGVAEVTKAIKNKLADALKKMWKARVQVDSNGSEYMLIEKTRSGELSTSEYDHKEYIIPLTEEEDKKFTKAQHWERVTPKIMITEKQYRIVYEFLKGRKVSDYPEVVFNSMIGKKVDDQFVISAIEVLRGEMEQVIATWKQTAQTTAQDFDAQIDQIRMKKGAELQRLEAEKNEKIKELQNQMKEIAQTAIQTPAVGVAD